jgi:DNA-binding PadR family transcriptional regulator
LVLLRERPSHGYELAERLSSIGIDARLGQSMYRLLHDIERQGLAQSTWDLSQSGGPPRRIYTISEEGEKFLAEATPELVRQRDALDAVLARFSHRSAAG